MNDIVVLQNLWNDDSKTRKDAVSLFKTKLQQNGWCFVELPQDIIIDTATISTLSHFFQDDTQGKTDYVGENGYGLSFSKHKEGVRILTGNHEEDFSKKGWIPPSVAPIISDLSKKLDGIAAKLLHSLAEPIFHCTSADALIERANLPSMDSPFFGMLDIAHYYNKTVKQRDATIPMGNHIGEVNCVPHYDPGLLSISFFSSMEGLQLLNSQNEWIDGPVNTKETEQSIGVVWLGQAATNTNNTGFFQRSPSLRPGIHRVIYPQESIPRLTMWYELCTKNQAFPSSLDDASARLYAVANVYNSNSLLKSTMTQAEVRKLLEQRLGVPGSKVETTTIVVPTHRNNESASWLANMAFFFNNNCRR